MRGMSFYVVRNQLQQVAVLKLNARGTSGELVKVVTSNDFVVPTMVTAFGNSLYLPNARSTSANSRHSVLDHARQSPLIHPPT